ncbi:hypothetical protein Xmau_02455 [Xenorhabdus mauleonii]|uniref:Uncharacterized protein n=1 Tax=Xenorhabdus mauleonii TaxID=351675 RepID=A0A1I3RE36_9GAMM|nr:hypothetical protein Xmau_02455 [Xenorhabdus mauleonii]SFJ44538.1 hypothetical protein SAMN05421680_10990 [Xenorhabdus mauleonii]
MRRSSLLSCFLYFMAFMFMCAPINVFAKTEHSSPEQITNDFYTRYMQQYLFMEHQSISDELFHEDCRNEKCHCDCFVETQP